MRGSLYEKQNEYYKLLINNEEEEFIENLKNNLIEKQKEIDKLEKTVNRMITENNYLKRENLSLMNIINNAGLADCLKKICYYD